MRRTSPKFVLSLPALIVAAGLSTVHAARADEWSGIVAFGFAYNDSIFVAIQSDRSPDHKLFIPVVGPWLDLGQRDCAAEPSIGTFGHWV